MAYAAAFYNTVSEMMNHISIDQIRDYFHKLKTESLAYQILEVFKWVVTIALMATVGVVGYYVFVGKCEGMIKDINIAAPPR